MGLGLGVSSLGFTRAVQAQGPVHRASAWLMRGFRNVLQGLLQLSKGFLNKYLCQRKDGGLLHSGFRGALDLLSRNQ